jgi:DNA-binding MarR family transcriptional regulator
MSRIIELAEQVLAVSKRAWVQDAQRGSDLTESEFLALDYLAKQGTATVGEIREAIGVLPAQMSRILRNLESSRFVLRDINREDKRRVNIVIMERGCEVFERARSIKLARITEALETLTPEEQDLFVALLNRIAVGSR